MGKLMAKYMSYTHMCIVSCFRDDVIKMLLNTDSFYNRPLRTVTLLTNSDALRTLAKVLVKF